MMMMMTPRHRVTIATLALTAALVTGCSQTTAHHGHLATPAHPFTPAATHPPAHTTAPPTTAADARPPGVPDPAGIDWTDPTAVARAGLITAWTADTTTDDPNTGQRDAFIRATPYLTPAYAAQLADEQNPPVSGQQWRIWSAHRAYTAATATAGHDDGAPADTATTAYRQVIVSTTPTGRDGWHGPAAASVVVFLRLTRSTGRSAWKIATMTVT